MYHNGRSMKRISVVFACMTVVLGAQTPQTIPPGAERAYRPEEAAT